MLLGNVSLYGQDAAISIAIDGNKIGTIGDAKQFGAGLHTRDGIFFERALVLPGLINSHDHLEFNLFPKLGVRHYDNYTQWGKNIWSEYPGQIQEILKIPLAQRLGWGLFKNLLCGVTTVVHHGEKIRIDNSLIEVFQDYQFIHSVSFERSWKLKLNKYSAGKCVVMHVGEGRDRFSRNEIDRLIRWNMVKKDIVAVHAVAMTPRQAKAFKATVWCPESNLFLFDQTMKVEELKNIIPIVFGTDSTLTADWNLWKHLRLAKQKAALSDSELLEMLTRTPARLWNLPQQGEIKAGYIADLIVLQPEGADQGIADYNPENILMVMKSGKIVLYDERIRGQIQHLLRGVDNCSAFLLNGHKKFCSGSHLTSLLSELKEYYVNAGFPITEV